jgi:hypothetical protein
MLTRFLTKGTLSALGAVVSWTLSRYGYADIAAVLTDPEFLQRVFEWIATGLTLYAGISQGIRPKAEASPEAPATELDPYPGWDFDPVRGWVRVTDGEH